MYSVNNNYQAFGHEFLTRAVLWKEQWQTNQLLMIDFISYG